MRRIKSKVINVSAHTRGYNRIRFGYVCRFQTTSQSVDEDIDRKVVVEQVIEFEPGLDSFTDKLMEVKNAQARVFLMYAR